MANQQEVEHSQNSGQDQGAGTEPNARSGRDMERRGAGTNVPAQRGQFSPPGPFSLMRRLSEDMDRVFNDFFGPGLFRWGGSDAVGRRLFEDNWPQVDVHHEGDKLIVQADVPGLEREDIHVEVRNRELRISGERHSEAERSERGFYRNERAYGSFVRTIALPEGTKPDTASASFENGVLRIEMEAPSSRASSKGRRIEVREGRPH